MASRGSDEEGRDDRGKSVSHGRSGVGASHCGICGGAPKTGGKPKRRWSKRRQAVDVSDIRISTIPPTDGGHTNRGCLRLQRDCSVDQSASCRAISDDKVGNRHYLSGRPIQPYNSKAACMKATEMGESNAELFRPVIGRSLSPPAILHRQRTSTECPGEGHRRRAAMQSLKTKVSSFGISVEVGVDKLDSVKIENLQLSVNDNTGQASARGTLACKTSDEALVEGGFSATAEVRLKVDLTTRKTTDISIEIMKTGGRFGDIVKGLETEVSGTLRRSLAKNLGKFCEK
ncbi:MULTISPECIES: hypothetical protein [Rhizobium]|uniref:hypothetical protein n=3 Tax=Rhizobium TaxID=379 RepID=UPI001FE40D29|nr:MULTISPECIES: hypothetical protein [Rhizobium]